MINVVGEEETEYLKDCVNQTYKNICYDLFGNDLLVTGTITTTSGSIDYELPSDFGMLVDIWAANKNPDIVTTHDYISNAINGVTTDLTNFLLYSFSASTSTVCNMVTATISSTDAADTMEFKIVGESLTGAYQEWFGTLNGVADVNISTASSGIGKIERVYIHSLTTGTCIIATAGGTTAFITLSAGITEYDGTLGRKLLRTTPAIDTGSTYIVLYKRQPKELVNDLDMIELPEYATELIIAGALSRYIKYKLADGKLLGFWRNEYEIQKRKIDSITNRQKNRHIAMTYKYDY